MYVKIISYHIRDQLLDEQQRRPRQLTHILEVFEKYGMLYERLHCNTPQYLPWLHFWDCQLTGLGFRCYFTLSNILEQNGMCTINWNKTLYHKYYIYMTFPLCLSHLVLLQFLHLQVQISFYSLWRT